jgi:medium-chain acyl-[acyl-carrier-protein] hydrolase
MTPDDPRRDAVTLFCFPHAGGSVQVFHRWSHRTPRGVRLHAVQPPGRGRRLREPTLRRLSAVVRDAARTVEPVAHRPFAFFGHSLGALTAFELARDLHRRGLPDPVHLFAAAARAPQIPPDGRELHALPRREFWDAVIGFSGTPAEVAEHRAFRDLLEPALRADFECYETYRYSDGPPLECPITAVGAAADPLVDDEQVARWSELTTGRFRQLTVAGGHFFPPASTERVIAVVMRTLTGGTGRA